MQHMAEPELSGLAHIDQGDFAAIAQHAGKRAGGYMAGIAATGCAVRRQTE
jgi:hypothetical protein